MITNASISELELALSRTNEKHDYQLSFREIVQQYNKVRFTLKSPSGIRGSRTTWSGRNYPAASWHAHGHFFDILFEINPKAFVKTAGRKITVDEGNWQDIQIGSRMFPMMMSETSIF